MTEATEIFAKLECNDIELIEGARAEIYSLFQNVRDSWVINGLYEYYLNTNSLRSMEILANVNEPHNKYLFDRLTESIKRQETELKIRALTLLGHLVRKQPTWVYKINDHPLMREILHVLKYEEDILALISALLLIIVLIPMIPSLIANHLQELFDIFSRLAAWNLGTGAQFNKQIAIHMQISLYALFLRLYGMYPCNFIAYLRLIYRDRNSPVFYHTIQPMLETVRMHPKLVTTTKEFEKSADRWKTIDVQQVIAECEQFYVDVVDKCPHDCCYVSTGLGTGFRSRSGTTNSTLTEKPKFQLDQLGDLCGLPSREGRSFFSPSMGFPERHTPVSSAPTDIVQLHQVVAESHDGASPPEAAVEATPETTPVRDTRTTNIIRTPHIGSSVVRGLTSFTKNKSANTTPTHSQPSSPMRKDASSPFNFPSVKRESATHQRLQKLLYERSQSTEPYTDSNSGITSISIQTTSAVRICVSSSETTSRNESPFSKEDEEVEAIVSQIRELPAPSRVCDSVLHENTNAECDIDSTLEQGSPCSQGGLHMPNSRSMNDFAKRVQRLRYHSQNYDRDSLYDSTGSSPGKDSASQRFLETTVRRASSCPEMKKKSPSTSRDSKPLKETEEETYEEEGTTIIEDLVENCSITRETQTEDSYMPYEHLFLNIFPCLGGGEPKPSPSPSPMPLKPFGEKENHHSVYNVLDKYMDIAKSEIANPNLQMQLLQHQLLFERYRRETFSARNRKLLADAKNAKALEEYNSALKDTIQLQQKDLDQLKARLTSITREHNDEERRLGQYNDFLKERIKVLQDQVIKLESGIDQERQSASDFREKYFNVDREFQQAASALFEAYAELNIAKGQAAMGEKARAEVERLNKEILLLGEMQMKQQEKLDETEKNRMVNAELEMLEIAHKEEVKHIKNKLDSVKSLMDAYQLRVVDLEKMSAQKDEGIAQLKKNLMEVNAENNEKIKAVESKYRTQLSINRSLEQKMLQLFTKIDQPSMRGLHSPETSSCHEVTASGLSPHSSPLSVSLASSESSNAFTAPDIKDVKNLQVLVDRKSIKQEDFAESDGENMEMSAQASTSGGGGGVAQHHRND